MQLVWLRPNKKGLVIFTSVLVLLPILLLCTLYPYWKTVGVIGVLVTLYWPVSMYLGHNISGQLSSTLCSLVVQLILLALASGGLYLLAWVEIGFCLSRVFYSIFTIVLSIPLAALVMARLRKSNPIIHKIVFTVLIVFVLIGLLGIYIARPLILLIYLMIASALSFPLIVLVALGFTRTAVTLWMLSICSLLALHNVPWSSHHRFLRDLDKIKPGRYLDRSDPGMIVLARRHGRGMTFAQVEETMRGYTKGTATGFDKTLQKTTNERGEVEREGNLIYRPSDNPGDSNWGIVTFKKNQVVSVRFSPD